MFGSGSTAGASFRFRLGGSGAGSAAGAGTISSSGLLPDPPQLLLILAASKKGVEVNTFFS
jgi:hypothetical protein